MSTLNMSPPPDDRFDLNKHRLNQNFDQPGGVRKLLTTVPVRKPDRQSFVRTQAGDEWQLPTFVLPVKDEGRPYLVDPRLHAALAPELVAVTLFTAITRQNVPFLWPVRLPGSDGKQDAWSRSLMEAAQRSMLRWVRVQANMALGAYEIYEAEGDLPDPTWPAEDFATILRIAFRDYYIDSLDHPVVRQLRGAQ